MKMLHDLPKEVIETFQKIGIVINELDEQGNMQKYYNLPQWFKEENGGFIECHFSELPKSYINKNKNGCLCISMQELRNIILHNMQLQHRRNAEDIPPHNKDVCNGRLDALRTTLNFIDTFYIEKEKQQIIDAFTAGQIDIANTFLKEYKERGFDNELDELAILNNDKEDGNEYFNNTFKN